ncbi:MAG: hypothetical protein SVV88_08775 [Pseudomonadota bacterium]|nr:hypothetical protein [Pseudomonadota bacterium]
MFIKRIAEVCGEVVEIVECKRCECILTEEEYNSETGTWTCTRCGDESEDDYNIKVIDEREDYREMDEYKVQRCEDPDCPCFGQELVDRGYGYPVCPSTQQK